MLLSFAMGAALAAITSLIACRLLMFAGVLDAPTHARKAHSAATPTSGGLGIATGFAAGVALLGLPMFNDWSLWVGAHDARKLAAGFIISLVFLAIGFVDDTRPLGPRLKFAIFVAASIAAALGVGAAMSLPIGLGLSIELGFAMGVIGSALWVFTLVNAVNFMDGANGLSMGSVAIGLLAIAATSFAVGAYDAVVLSVCGAGALIGFLVWNFPRGRLFAGDSGALFAGAVAAMASLLLIGQGGVSPFVPPIIFFPLLADVLLTLAWRVGRGRRVLEGHNEHIYQIGMRVGLSHTQITLAYWALALQCGLFGFLAAVAAYAGQSTLETAEAGGTLWTTAGALTFLPVIAFLVVVFGALQISRMTRRLAVARGLASEPIAKKQA